MFFTEVILLSNVSAQETPPPKAAPSFSEVSVYLPSSDEEQKLKLRPKQKASIYVFLSSLGDSMDKFMVSLVSLTDNKLVANKLSGPDGEVVFRKIPPGEYTVFVNRRVLRDEEMSSVKVADVRLKATN